MRVQPAEIASELEIVLAYGGDCDAICELKVAVQFEVRLVGRSSSDVARAHEYVRKRVGRRKARLCDVPEAKLRGIVMTVQQTVQVLSQPRVAEARLIQHARADDVRLGYGELLVAQHLVVRLVRVSATWHRRGPMVRIGGELRGIPIMIDSRKSILGGKVMVPAPVA